MYMPSYEYTNQKRSEFCFRENKVRYRQQLGDDPSPVITPAW